MDILRREDTATDIASVSASSSPQRLEKSPLEAFELDPVPLVPRSQMLALSRMMPPDWLLDRSRRQHFAPSSSEDPVEPKRRNPLPLLDLTEHTLERGGSRESIGQINTLGRSTRQKHTNGYARSVICSIFNRSGTFVH